MFDWIGDALGWVGDKISGAVSSVGSAISEAVWDIMLEWLFKTIYGAVADFFGMINSMAAEIFELNWVNAFLSLFSSFGWTGGGCVRYGDRISVGQGKYTKHMSEYSERLYGGKSVYKASCCLV